MFTETVVSLGFFTCSYNGGFHCYMLNVGDIWDFLTVTLCFKCKDLIANFYSLIMKLRKN